MSEKSLREQLIGAWMLASCVEHDIETAVEDHPLGDRPLGLILYTPDGYVSAQLQRRERRPFADGDLFRATPEEYSAAAEQLGAVDLACLTSQRDELLLALLQLKANEDQRPLRARAV
jgi:hypothetical protein